MEDQFVGYEKTRRKALKLFGASTVAGLSGCIGGSEDQGNETRTPSAEEKILGEGPADIASSEVALILNEGQGFTYHHQGRQYGFLLNDASDEEADFYVEVVIPDEVGQNKEGIDPVSEFERTVDNGRATSIDDYTDLFYGGREEDGYLVAAGHDENIESDFEDR